MNYWLMKTEPSVYGIDHLAKMPGQIDYWDGIRNYQVRNMIRDDMQKGDCAFLYHSSCKQVGIVGVLEIVKPAYPDPTAFDPNHPHFDPKSDPAAPRWFMVDVKLISRFSRMISLAELKAERALQNMRVLARGNRLSIMPISVAHWQHILAMQKK